MTISTLTSKTTYCVVYCTGGTVNFKWNRSIGMSAMQAAELRGTCARMGYRAMVVNYAHSIAIGLPESWDDK